MSEWKKVQDQVNESADKKLNDYLDKCFACLCALDGGTSITFDKQEVPLGQIIHQTKSSLFAILRNGWREKEGKTLIESIMDKQL